MRHLIAFASVVAVVQGLAGRTRGVPLAQKPTLFSRGSYFARRAREDAARAVRRALFGDQLSQLQVGGPRAIPDGGRVVVTGSTSGVGLDVAREVAALGYDVVVCGRDEKKLERAVALVGRVARRGVESARFDLESLTETRAAAAAIGRADGLVLCAGCWPTTLRYTARTSSRRGSRPTTWGTSSWRRGSSTRAASRASSPSRRRRTPRRARTAWSWTTRAGRAGPSTRWRPTPRPSWRTCSSRASCRGGTPSRP